MIKFITKIEDPLLDYVKDDPVRPELSKEFRVSHNRFVSYLIEDKVNAVVCVSLHDFVPESVEDINIISESPDTAVFYTIWSYQSGSGNSLLRNTVEKIKHDMPLIKRFITLSPKTEMAKRFHLKNGAKVFRENEHTINYEYKIG